MVLEFSAQNGVTCLAGVRERDAVRKIFGGGYRVVGKSLYGVNTTDSFVSEGLKVFYDVLDCVSGVELYHPQSELFLAGANALGISLGELKLLLVSLGCEFCFNAEGVVLISFSGQARFYVPESHEEKDLAIVEAVYIGVPGL